MKKKLSYLLFFLSLFVLLGFRTNAVDSDQLINIFQATSINSNEEYLIKDTTSNKSYSGFVGETIRVYYEDVNVTETISISDYYLEIVNQLESTYFSYVDIKLKNKGESILLIESKNSITDVVEVYDALKITIYDEITNLKISTIYNEVYENKKLVIDYLVNDDSNLFSSNINFDFYDDAENKLDLDYILTKDNQVVLLIDSTIATNERIFVYASYNDITSDVLEIKINDVSYLTYFDLELTNINFCLADNVGSIYIRVPLNSTPDLTLLDKSQSVSLINYTIEDCSGYSLVKMNVNLLKGTSNQRVLIGGLMDDSLKYTYKEVYISILTEVNNISINSNRTDINYGDVERFTLIVNDNISNISCDANWYVNDVLVYTGSYLDYEFTDSGYVYVRAEYQGLDSSYRVYVGYSTMTTSLWYLLLLGLIVLGIPSIFAIMKRNSKKILMVNKKARVLSEDIKKITINSKKRQINKAIGKLKRITMRSSELAEGVDNTFLDSAITECKKLSLILNSFMKLETKRKKQIIILMKNKMEKILAVFNSACDVEEIQIHEKVSD